MPIPGKPAAPGSSSGPMMIQSISNIKIIEFTVSQLLDQLVIDRIQSELLHLIEKAGHPKMIISFEGVSAISSSMLGTLITLNKKTKEAKGELRLAHVAPPLMQVLKLTNLHKLLKIYDTTDKALAKF